jgi:type I restriction enzyme S subunit
MAMYGATIGKLGILKTPMTTNQACCACITFEGMYNKFLFYFLLGNRPAFIKMGAGGAQPNISKDKIVNYPLALPPLAEQERIVAKIEELLPLIDRYGAAWNRLEDFNKRFPTDMQKSLLQMAIQGKLVEQRPEEGTGEELYQQIQAEKQALIKAGKIKKDKPLPEITDDEKPFDIPEGWKWCRIGQIFNLQAGKNISASNIYVASSEEHPYLCYGGNGVRGFVSNYNRDGHYALIGRQGALCGNINHADGQFYATEHAVVVEHFDLSDVLWCGYFLKALNLNQYATATAQPGLAVANIVKVLIPLPPLAEQQRIVAKLEELLPLCERLK